MIVVLFVSRNKDNKNLEDFKERRVSFVSDELGDSLLEKFEHFVELGRDGEMCRLYQSVNKRDPQKIRIALLHSLIDDEHFNPVNLPQKLASIAAKKENATEKKWLFDFDENETMIEEFISDIEKAGLLKNEIQTHKTPNGYAVIVERGFDTRELLCKWPKVELKRDDLLCIDWKVKEVLG